MFKTILNNKNNNKISHYTGTYRQTDIFRHGAFRYIGKRFVRTPAFDILGHFAGRPVSVDSILLVKSTIFHLFFPCYL